jgi:hypothetical protein
MMVAMVEAGEVDMEEDVAEEEEGMEEVVDGVEEEDMEGRTMATEVEVVGINEKAQR